MPARSCVCFLLRSYDVTLGRYYYRESDPEPGTAVYNPYSATMVERVWGTPKEAEEAGEWMARTGTVLENIAPSDRIIWLKPGTRAHTPLAS